MLYAGSVSWIVVLAKRALKPMTKLIQHGSVCYSLEQHTWSEGTAMAAYREDIARI